MYSPLLNMKNSELLNEGQEKMQKQLQSELWKKYLHIFGGLKKNKFYKSRPIYQINCKDLKKKKEQRIVKIWSRKTTLNKT